VLLVLVQVALRAQGLAGIRLRERGTAAGGRRENLPEHEIPFAPPWFENAADLLAEDDPSETPFLVEDLVVDGSIAALVGPPKKGKTWTLLDLAVAVATGEKALGRFAVADPGPVLLVLEESGRAALHRRLDKLVRGRAIAPERVDNLYFAANRRVQLNDKDWRDRLMRAWPTRHKAGWRLIALDPLARVKGASTDENSQKEIGPVLDFMRELRAEHNAAVLYVHHTPHDGTRHRGSSDFESYWESKLTLVQTGERRTLTAEHREAEAAGPFALSFGFEGHTGTLRLRVSEDELLERVREYMDEHPDASANEVDENVEGNRKRILAIVKTIREGGSDTLEPPGTTDPGQRAESGSTGALLREPGTTPTDPLLEVVPNGGNHPGDDTYLERMFAAFEAGHIIESEWRQAHVRRIRGRPHHRVRVAASRARASVRVRRGSAGRVSELLTTREVSALLRVSPETVLRWWRSGKLPGGRRLGSNVLRFSEAELEAWLEDCSRPGRAVSLRGSRP
jgi:excisionase family DNA binding protein